MTAAVNRPGGCGELFIAFTQLAMQGFGGVMAVAHRELVERRAWLSNEEFLQEVALAQALPGPNVCNLALMLGDRLFGWRGAVSALGGLIAVPLVVLLAAALAYGAWSGHPQVQAVLRGMGAVVAGMVGGTAIKLARELKDHPLGWPGAGLLAAAAVLGLAWLRWPMVAMIVGLGGLGMACTWYALRKAGRE